MKLAGASVALFALAFACGASALVAACDRAKSATPAAPQDPPAASPASGPTPSHLEAPHYKVDAKIGDCAAAAECAATVRLEALGAYHINETYPYKLTVYGADGGTTSDGVELLGKAAANRAVFGKNEGDFDKQGEKVGVLTVRLKAPKGKIAFAGRYKLSVCSQANCELEQVDVGFEGAAK